LFPYTTLFRSVRRTEASSDRSYRPQPSRAVIPLDARNELLFREVTLLPFLTSRRARVARSGSRRRLGSALPWRRQLLAARKVTRFLSALLHDLLGGILETQGVLLQVRIP